MPSGKVHLLIGGSTAMIFDGLLQLERMATNPKAEFDWSEFCLCTLAGAGAGLLPDLLEPADSPKHRKFCHSILAGVLIAYWIGGKHTKKWSPTKWLIWSVIGVGYLSHLVADARTPKSISFC